MEKLLIRNNLPHVVTVFSEGSYEELHTGEPNISDLIEGLKELHSIGISVLDIKYGISAEGTTKISSPDTFGTKDQEPPNTRYNLPEDDIVPFKSDMWCLGCVITGKNVPRRYTKSQEVLDSYSDTFGPEKATVLRSLLVLDPENRRL
jgi:hypothetical protein